MDCFHPPTLTHAQYDMTVPPPPLSLSHLLCPCWGSQFVFVSQWKPLNVSKVDGNLFCFVFFGSSFVKLMIHIVLEPPATIKTVKSYACSPFIGSLLI